MGDINYKLGPTYGQSIPKFAVRPSFFNITSPNLGPARLEITPMASNMILGNHRVPGGGKENGSCVF